MSEAEFDKTQVLSGPVPETPAASSRGVLRCVDTSVLHSPAGIEIKLVSKEVTVGRGSENVVALDAHGVSRSHARMFFEEGAWQIEDLGSTNGTRVNNSKIERCALADGDTVAFGRVCYKYHEVDAAAGASSVMDLDLGAAQQTVVLHPKQTPPAAAAPAPAPKPPPPAAEPGAEQVYDTGKRRRVSAPEQTTTSSKTWLIVAGVVLVLAGCAAAAYFLGFF